MVPSLASLTYRARKRWDHLFIIIFIDMSACIKLNGKSVPCKDVLSIMLVCVSDEVFSEFTYRDFEPCYHTVRVLVPRKKAYRLEVAVRKAQNK